MDCPECNTETPPIEEWRPCRAYEELYSVSNYGRVRRDAYARQTHVGKIRKLRPDKDGYLTVSLWRQGKAKTLKVHRLVALAFIEIDPTRPKVNHQDGVKTHCHRGNLEWCTNLENSRHAKRTGLTPNGDRNGARKHPETRPRGENNGMNTHPESRQYGEKGYFAKLTNTQAAEIRSRYVKGKKGLIKLLAAEFGISRITVHRVGNGLVYPTARDGELTELPLISP